MANPKGSPQNLKYFQKGQSGNPEGGRKHDPELKKLKNLTQAELIEVGTFIVKGKMSELRALMKNPDTSALQAMVAGLAIKTMSKGDPAAFNALMDRLLGKVKEHIQHSGEIGGAPNVIIKIPDNGRSSKE